MSKRSLLARAVRGYPKTVSIYCGTHSKKVGIELNSLYEESKIGGLKPKGLVWYFKADHKYMEQLNVPKESEASNVD